MRLYLLRHEDAEERTSAKPDVERHLTGKGKGNALRRATRLRERLTKIDIIVTSSAARAVQTADIFASILGKADKVEKSTAFVPSARAREVLKSLAAYHHHNQVMLVGHGPWINDLASLLICGTTDAHIRIKKGGLLRIDVAKLTPGGGELIWLR